MQVKYAGVKFTRPYSLQATSRAVTPESGHGANGQELPFIIPEPVLLHDPPADAALTEASQTSVDPGCSGR